MDLVFRPGWICLFFSERGHGPLYWCTDEGGWVEAYALTRRAESLSDKVGRAPLSHTNKTLTSTSLPLYFQVVVCFCLRKKKLVQTNIKWRGLENINNSSSTLFKLKSVLCCIHRRPAQHPGEIKGLFWNGGMQHSMKNKQRPAALRLCHEGIALHRLRCSRVDRSFLFFWFPTYFSRKPSSSSDCSLSVASTSK